MSSPADADLSDIRNIGIVAHIDAGKTTTTERILYYTGREHRMGSVDEGTTVTDYLEEERRRGITITAAATSCFWRDKMISIIDTPGHVDFTAEVERSLRVLDGAVVIFDSVEGVEAQSETVWRQADKYKVPRIAFANKLDRIGASFDRVLDSMKERLHVTPLPIQMPWGIEHDFKGVIDLLRMNALTFVAEELGSRIEIERIPEDLFEEAAIRRDELIEKIAELDELILEKYIEGTEPTIEELIAALRRITVAFKAVPVLCGSSLRNKGIQPLLDAIVDFLPSPLDVPPVFGVNPKTEKEELRRPDPDEPLAALAFKIISNPTGDLTFIRVYSGTLEKGMRVYNPRLDKYERVAQVYRMHADTRQPVDCVRAGDIVAVTGFKVTATGDTICGESGKIMLEKMAFPETLVSMAIEPETNTERQRLELALSTIAHEDPTFKHGYDNETGQLIISGMGELHLEIVANRLIGEFKVKMRTGEPRVSYRETVTRNAEAWGEFAQLVAGRPQYARVRVRIEPNPNELAPRFANEVRDMRLSREFLATISESALSSASAGVLASYPSINVRIVLTGFEFREQESVAPAYAAATNAAYKEAFSAASPVLLEPLMQLEVTTPEDYLGAIINDLNRRRVTIGEIHDGYAGSKIVRGTVPLSEMFGYATVVRSLSQGRATYTLEASSYQPVPDEMAKKILLI